MSQKVRIGIDVGGTKIAYGLFDSQFKVLAKKVEASMPMHTAEEMMDAMGVHVRELVQQAGGSMEEVEAIGVVFPSHTNYKTGTVIASANLPAWQNIQAKQPLEQRFGVPVYVNNDVNVAALAEARLGAGKGKENLLYITISTGVGAGIYLNNKIYYGTYGTAGEIGHSLVDTTTRIRCGCGQVGCLESTASGTGMAKHAKVKIMEGNTSLLPGLAGGVEKITAYHIGIAAQQKDTVALEVLEYAANQLARYFVTVFHVFSVDTIIYGGGASKLGNMLFDPIRKKMKEYAPILERCPLNLIPSHFGDDVSIFGAALVTLEE